MNASHVASITKSSFYEHVAGRTANLPESKWFSNSPVSNTMVYRMNWFVIVVVRLLEGMFVIGSIGSVVVLVLSGIEDFRTLFGKEEENHS
jgi:hypothetical protein